MAATLLILHLTFNHQTSRLSLDISLPSSSRPRSHTLTAPPPVSSPSSHDHLAVVHWSQALIVKAPPDAPPHGVCSPVRLIPQI